MKKIFKIIFISLCLFLIITPFALPQAAVIETSIQAQTTTSLNVRTQPNSSSEILQTLSPNTEILCYYTKGNEWSKIYRNNKIGYINNNYLIEKTSNKKLNDFFNQNKNTDIQSQQTERLYEPADFQFQGVIHYGGWRWTWYTSRILPGQGLYLPGRHDTEDGYICDGDEYVCIASVDLPQGTIVDTPFGYQGKVYDTGCPHGTLDVYVNWG